MHKPLTKSSASWKLIIVISSVILFIILISWFQLVRTLDAVKQSNNNFDKKKSTFADDVDSSSLLNLDDHDHDHNAVLKDHLGHFQDVHNTLAEDKQQQNKKTNKYRKNAESEDENRAYADVDDSTENKNSKSSPVRTIAPRLLNSLKQHRDQLEAAAAQDAFVTKLPIKDENNLDIELFVIWHDALSKTHKILADIRSKFYVVAIEYFDWNQDRLPRDKFETNLWRLYNGKGGWVRTGMAKKVKQCGYGPFIALVVVDPQPKYQVEKTAHGDDTVNHNMNTAKKMYRSWSGGGFRVHGTFGPQESEHDIPLLFHRAHTDFAVVAKKMMTSAAEDDEQQQGKKEGHQLLLVDQFVSNILRFDEHHKKEEHYLPVIYPRMIPYKPHHLNPRREIFSSDNKNDDNQEWKLDDPLHDRALHHRDFVFRNDFITARETFGVNGFGTCRDILLLLKSYMDTKQVTSVIARSRSDDNLLHVNEAVQTYHQLTNDLECDQWKEELVITLAKGDDEDKVRWGVSSLFASSSTRNLYDKKNKYPIGFEGVPLGRSKSLIVYIVAGGDDKKKRR